MFMQSIKAAKLWNKLLDQAIDKDIEDVVHDDIDNFGKLEGFESSTRAEDLFEEYFPKKAEHITFFFDPNDGGYGYLSTLSEEELLAALEKVAKKHKL